MPTRNRPAHRPLESAEARYRHLCDDLSLLPGGKPLVYELEAVVAERLVEAETRGAARGGEMATSMLISILADGPPRSRQEIEEILRSVTHALLVAPVDVTESAVGTATRELA